MHGWHPGEAFIIKDHAFTQTMALLVHAAGEYGEACFTRPALCGIRINAIDAQFNAKALRFTALQESVERVSPVGLFAVEEKVSAFEMQGTKLVCPEADLRLQDLFHEQDFAGEVFHEQAHAEAGQGSAENWRIGNCGFCHASEAKAQREKINTG
jgi:hypothetical protein